METTHLVLSPVLLIAAWWMRGVPRPSTAVGAGVVLVLGGLVAAALDLWGGGPFLALRSLAWMVFGYLPAYLAIAGIFLYRPAPGWAAAAGLSAVAIVAVGAWAFFVEPTRLEVGTVRIESAEIEQAVRIVVLADLQTDEIGPYEERVFDTIESLDADLILLAGDYLHVPTAEAWRVQATRLRPLLDRLESPLGAWAVSGDTEPRYWTELFAGTPVRPLTSTRTVDLGPLLLTGVDASTARRGSAVVEPTARSEGRFHVLLAHPPDVVLGRPPVDLVVAGHVHGGQVQLPFLGPLVTFSRVPREWAVGHTELPWGGDLVVSRGVGMERGAAPRLRFLCRPELVVIEIGPAG